MALVLGSSLVDTCTNYLPTSESHKISKKLSQATFYWGNPQKLLGQSSKKTVTFGHSAGSVQSVNKAGVYSPLAEL